MGTNKLGLMAAVLLTVGAAAVAAVAGTFAWAAHWPWSVAAGALAAVAGLWAGAGALAIARLLASVGPSEAEAPEAEETDPARAGWQVTDGARAFDVDLLPQLRPQTETLLIQRQPTLQAEDPLTRLDLAWCLWKCYTVGPARRFLIGALLPSGRRLRRWQYDEAMGLFAEAGIITDRKPRYAGAWAAGLTLTAALAAIGIENIDDIPVNYWQLGNLGSPGLGWARLGLQARFLKTKVLLDERTVKE